MSLAFDRRNSKCLSEVYKIAGERSKRYSATSKRIVAEGDIRALRREFKKRPIPHDVVEAILDKPNRAIL